MKIKKSRTNQSTVEALNLLETTTEKLFPAHDYVNNSLVYGYLANNKKDWLFLTSNSNFKVELLNEMMQDQSLIWAKFVKLLPYKNCHQQSIKQCYESAI